MMYRTPLVRLVDDDADFRAAQALILRTFGYEVAQYESAEAFLADPSPDRFGCVLLDIRMPGMTGLELQKKAAALGGRIPIIFLTGHGDMDTAVRAMRRGARDFLAKSGGPERLLEAVRKACSESEAAFERERAQAGATALYESLTPREREVLTMAASGQGNKEIAEFLGIGTETVKMHRANAFAKVGAKSALDAYRWLETVPESVRKEAL